MTRRNLVSVVVPVYNEETNVRPFYDQLTAAVEPLDVDVEVIFVDDGSGDRTFELIEELAGGDPRVKAIKLSRNFGSHPALTAGLLRAAGDAAVLISVDLQDPPELIGTFVEHWRQGYNVVWGVRKSRDDPWAKKLFANVFYAVLRAMALPQYPRRGMDCGLLDRKVLDALGRFPEVNRVLPPMIVWAGFRQAEVSYHRGGRHSGVSKWPLGKRIKSAIDILVSFSALPIRFISYLGFAISLMSFLYACFLIVGRLLWGVGAAGWPSVMVTVLFLGGVQLIMLGILGEYLWRTSDQVRGRPLFLVMEELGFEATGPGGEG